MIDKQIIDQTNHQAFDWLTNALQMRNQSRYIQHQQRQQSIPYDDTIDRIEDHWNDIVRVWWRLCDQLDSQRTQQLCEQYKDWK